MTKNIFDKIELSSGKTFENRLVMAPMTTQCSFHDGSVTDELVQYYTRRAGGPAAVIVESTFIDNYGRAFEGALGADSDDKIPGLKKLADGIKKKGSKAIIQLYHAGRMGTPELNKGRRPISASSIAALRDNAVEPRTLEADEIEDMIQLFADAVRRVIEAGFDGVELHGANTYLLQQFYSPHSNRRDDEWGGSRENRLRFPRRVAEKVRETANELGQPDFIIGYRFSPEELEEPGINFDDTMYLLNHLADHSIDYFHFSMGSWQRTSIIDTADEELLLDKYLNAASDRLKEIPIMGAGGIKSVEDAEAAIHSGFDMMSVGKAHLINPDFVNLLKDNVLPNTFLTEGDDVKLTIPAPLWNILGFLKE
ncbi:fumarate reductase flavoprotein subunit [Jeotgalicoccus aerolatus]|uniref:Fumarate reductase flavoprotein subunit n=1 Tax=Jeotgalicoccus aerolatus TaxID=709510 RepID=A0A1G9DJP7_9STAP|nr:NADH-dependent flavin oxidoreductase [Jeotgalicoccus aerolatus]SDK64098.1 fumarate reductase flavoprotein subunit [Jeotgalicoccus aerolatus]HJG33638.1 NADH-dependent flavin oxidoreductase [Jeotgalicoccus aerolatus]